eukprot:TRINITY_DN18668_c0_g1_i3.p1 TRINITY_DN18668_c0_g1~~TRINITY_DN18668_c0_g1_i3.p1  ORF type:complete len:273 (-),score=59.72 TRINITY_DN18668_c0_g1_i3:56-874(-)
MDEQSRSSITNLEADADGIIAEACPARLLTIAGSDSGGGAGIQADLKTFAALKTFGMSVLTALTAQNTQGVQGVHMLPASFVGEQLDSVLGDLGADAIKTGMLGTKEIVEVTAAKVKEYRVATVIVDPVMVSTSGHALLQPDAVETYKTELFPLATVITPNIKEAQHLLGFDVRTMEDMKKAAVALHKMGPKWVLVKGGDKHGEQEDATSATDVLFDGQNFYILRAPRVNTKNLHGTGCTFASALASYLAKDLGPIGIRIDVPIGIPIRISI